MKRKSLHRNAEPNRCAATSIPNRPQITANKTASGNMCNSSAAARYNPQPHVRREYNARKVKASNGIQRIAGTQQHVLYAVMVMNAVMLVLQWRCNISHYSARCNATRAGNEPPATVQTNGNNAQETERNIVEYGNWRCHASRIQPGEDISS
jgi:hypothetical protein